MQQKKVSNSHAPPRLAAIIADALNLYAGAPVNFGITADNVNPRTVAVIKRELQAQNFTVGGVPIAGDLRAFVFGLLGLKGLAGYQPEWADQPASSLNAQREGIARLFAVAAANVAGLRFEHEWERCAFADPIPGQAARLVPAKR